MLEPKTKKVSPTQTVREFFRSKGQEPFRFQRQAWKAFLEGDSGFIHSATGTGKTLAAWLGPILNWLKLNPRRNEWNPKAPTPLRVLWITPLRALAADTENALRGPIEAMGLPWLLESRTGDSTASSKTKQLKRLPTALITTPESLCLLLTHASLLSQLSGIEAVIVDEWHELLGSKRGIQVELALARLRKLNPLLRTWGLGTVEESFVSKLKPKDRFLFAGRLVELVMIRDNVAYVKRSKGVPDAVPRWMGGRLPLSSELSEALRSKVQEAAEGKRIGPEMRSLKGLLAVQARWIILPRSNELLVELTRDRSGFQIFLFLFEGRIVHEGMAALLAFRLSKRQKTTFSMACNDHGIVLQSPHLIPIENAISNGLFSPDGLEEDIRQSMNATEMAKRQFRQIARVAGLVQSNLPGQRKSTNHIQASSNLFFDVFREYDPGNLLLEQCRREVLEQQLEISRLLNALLRLERGRIVVMRPPKVTPLAFSLWVDKLRDRLSSETLADRVARMQSDLEAAADRES